LDKRDELFYASRLFGHSPRMAERAALSSIGSGRGISDGMCRQR
jgi:hypothetical protein